MSERSFEINRSQIAFHHEKSKAINENFTVLFDGTAATLRPRLTEPYQTSTTTISIGIIRTMADVYDDKNAAINDVVNIFDGELERIGVKKLSPVETKTLVSLLEQIV